MNNEISKLVKDLDLEMLFEKEWKHNSKENLRWLFYLTELQKLILDKYKVDVIAISVRFTGHTEIGYWTYAIESIQPVGKQIYKFDTYEIALEQGILEGLKQIKLQRIIE